MKAGDQSISHARRICCSTQLAMALQVDKWDKRENVMRIKRKQKRRKRKTTTRNGKNRLGRGRQVKSGSRCIHCGSRGRFGAMLTITALLLCVLLLF